MIDFVVPTRHSYKERRKKSLIVITLVVGVLLIFSLLSGNDIILVSSILLFLFLVQMYRSSKADRYFIKNLKIKNEDIQITYEDRGSEVILAGKLGEMTIKKEEGFRTIYLSIYKNNELLLQQFIRGDWTEAKFDEVEQYIRKLRITGREIG